MEMPIQFDTLDYAKKLQNAGIPAAQAEAHASALGDVLGKSIVVHGELMAVEERLNTKIDAVEERLNVKIDALEEKMDQKFAASEEKINYRFITLEQKIDARFKDLESQLKSDMNIMRWMMGTLIFLVSGLLLRLLQT